MSVVQLTEHGHAPLDPVLWLPAGGQRHGDHKVGGVPRGGQRSLPLAGLVQRAHVQHSSGLAALLLSWMMQEESKQERKKERKEEIELINENTSKRSGIGFMSIFPSFAKGSHIASSVMLTRFDPDDGHRVKQDFGLLLCEHATDGRETYFNMIITFFGSSTHWAE